MEGDDEDVRKRAPKHIREKSLGGLGPYQYVRIPFMGDDENPVFFNMGKYIPILSLFQGAQGAQSIEWMPGFLSPNGPFTSVMYAFAGYDPFTGKHLSTLDATPTRAKLDRAAYFYNSMVPTVAGTKFIGKVKGDIAGDKDSMGRETDSLYLARTLGGMGLYQFNEETSAFWQRRDVRDIKRAFKSAMRKAQMQEQNRGYPDREALDETMADLRTRMESAIKKVQGEE